MWVFFSFSRRGRHLRGGNSTVFSPETVIRNELALPTGKTSEALFTSHTNSSRVSEPSLRRVVVSRTLPVGAVCSLHSAGTWDTAVIVSNLRRDPVAFYLNQLLHRSSISTMLSPAPFKVFQHSWKVVYNLGLHSQPVSFWGGSCLAVFYSGHRA